VCTENFWQLIGGCICRCCREARAYQAPPETFWCLWRGVCFFHSSFWFNTKVLFEDVMPMQLCNAPFNPALTRSSKQLLCPRKSLKVCWPVCIAYISRLTNSCSQVHDICTRLHSGRRGPSVLGPESRLHEAPIPDVWVVEPDLDVKTAWIRPVVLYYVWYLWRISWTKKIGLVQMTPVLDPAIKYMYVVFHSVVAWGYFETCKIQCKIIICLSKFSTNIWKGVKLGNFP